MIIVFVVIECKSKSNEQQYKQTLHRLNQVASIFSHTEGDEIARC